MNKRGTWFIVAILVAVVLVLFFSQAPKFTPYQQTVENERSSCTCSGINYACPEGQTSTGLGSRVKCSLVMPANECRPPEGSECGVNIKCFDPDTAQTNEFFKSGTCKKK